VIVTKHLIYVQTIAACIFAVQFPNINDTLGGIYTGKMTWREHKQECNKSVSKSTDHQECKT